MKSKLTMVISVIVRKSLMIQYHLPSDDLDVGTEKVLRKFADGTKLGGLADNIRWLCCLSGGLALAGE